MNKYVAPILEIQKLNSADVITASGGVVIGELEGVDNGESKTAIYDANYWINN